jgi:hypothetical protein
VLLTLLHVGACVLRIEPPPKRQKVQDGKVPEALDVGFGQFISTEGLPLLHAAHTKGVEPPKMYVRQPVVDILKLLDDKGDAGFWLKGAPGTGKSQVARLWATQQARQGKAVVYGEVRGAGFWVTEFSKDKDWEQFELNKYTDFSNTLKTASKAKNTAVVFDGATGKKGSAHADLAGYLLQAGGIVISSSQLEYDGYPCNAEMTGWLLEEFTAATDNAEFFGGTKQLANEFKGDFKDEKQRRVFVAKKYNTTGGSARLMCEHTTASATKLLKAAMDKLSTQEKKGVLLGDFQPSNIKSKNILSQGFTLSAGNYDTDNVKHTFTSKFVLTTLRASIDLEEVKRLYRHCKNLHRVIEGWAFEELQLRLFEHDEKNADALVELRVRDETKFDTDGQEESWETVPLLTFNTKAFQEEDGVLLDLTGNPIMLPNFDKVILRPDSTFNESWDAVLISKETIQGQPSVFHLTFLEVTLQKSHTLSEMALVQGFQRFHAVNANVSSQVCAFLLARVWFSRAWLSVTHSLFIESSGSAHGVGRGRSVFPLLFQPHLHPAYDRDPFSQQFGAGGFYHRVLGGDHYSASGVRIAKQLRGVWFHVADRGAGTLPKKKALWTAAPRWTSSSPP